MSDSTNSPRTSKNNPGYSEKNRNTQTSSDPPQNEEIKTVLYSREPSALEVSLSVLMAKTAVLLREHDSESFVFPVMHDGVPYRVTVTRDQEREVPPQKGFGFRVSDFESYYGYYDCGHYDCGHSVRPAGSMSGPVIKMLCPVCPESSEGELKAIVDGRLETTCQRHGQQPKAWRIKDGSVEKSGGACLLCIVDGTSPKLEEKASESKTEAASVMNPDQTEQRLCPLGKSPCALQDPNVAVDPGLYRVPFAGRDVDMCGACVNECGAEVIGQARSIDRLTPNNG